MALCGQRFALTKLTTKGLMPLQLPIILNVIHQKKHVNGDDNSSYEIALPRAQQKNIILIKAGEITRSMAPGHFNTLFLKDTQALDVENWRDAFAEAKKQGAYFIWNHPGWKAQTTRYLHVVG